VIPSDAEVLRPFLLIVLTGIGKWTEASVFRHCAAGREVGRGRGITEITELRIMESHRACGFLRHALEIFRRVDHRQIFYQAYSTSSGGGAAERDPRSGHGCCAEFGIVVLSGSDRCRRRLSRNLGADAAISAPD